MLREFTLVEVLVNAMKQAKNVGELRKLTYDCNRAMPLLEPFTDHQYRETFVHRGTAVRHPDGSWSEDYGDAINPAEWRQDGSERVEVLIVK